MAHHRAANSNAAVVPAVPMVRHVASSAAVVLVRTARLGAVRMKRATTMIAPARPAVVRAVTVLRAMALAASAHPVRHQAMRS